MNRDKTNHKETKNGFQTVNKRQNQYKKKSSETKSSYDWLLKFCNAINRNAYRDETLK